MPDLSDGFFIGDNGDNEDSDGAPAEDPSASPKEPKSTDKRISDLQSARDKETARANKAEARLTALLAAEGKGAETPSATPAGGEVNGAILEMARMFAVQQNPKLAEYDITSEELFGNTPAEIARSAAELVAKYEKIETRARNKVLAANGIAPELEGAGEPKPDRDFSQMSSEDFAKIMDAAMTGARL